MSTRFSVIGSVSWSTATTIAKFAVQLAQFLVLARFLSAESLGLLAFIGICVSLSQLVGDGGLSNALIFHKKLSRNEMYQLYTFGLLIGLSAALISFTVIPWAGFYLNLPDLESFALVVSGVIFIRVCIAQPIAQLQKELKFYDIAVVEVSSQFSGFLATCALLWQGFGVTGAVYAQLLQAIVLLILCLFLHPEKFGITWPHFKVIKGPLKYGCYQMFENLTGLLSRQFDQLVILKLLGAETLGIYSYLKDLIGKPMLQLINPTANRVLFPMLVNVSKDKRAYYYLNAVALLSLINMPLYIGIAYFSEPFLELILGGNWSEFHEFASLLALTYLIVSVINPCSSLLQATGAVKRSFYWNVIVTLLRIVVILLIVPFGLFDMLLALLILQVIILIAHWYFLIKPCVFIGLLEFAKAPVCIIAVALVSLRAVIYLNNLFSITFIAQLSVFLLINGLGIGLTLLVFRNLGFGRLS